MDTSDNAGSDDARKQLLHNANVFGRMLGASVFAEDARLALADLSTEPFTELAKALSEGDRAVTRAFLRGWGVWRSK